MTRTFCVTRKKVDREINSRLIGTLEGFYGFLNGSLNQFKDFRLELLWFHWTSSTANWNQLRIVLRILTMRVMVLCNCPALFLSWNQKYQIGIHQAHFALHTHTLKSLCTLHLGTTQKNSTLKLADDSLRRHLLLPPCCCCYCCFFVVIVAVVFNAHSTVTPQPTLFMAARRLLYAFLPLVSLCSTLPLAWGAACSLWLRISDVPCPAYSPSHPLFCRKRIQKADKGSA